MLKRVSIALAVVALFSFTIAATSWKADTVHSRFGFTVKHLGIADFNGNFKTYAITIKSEKPDFSDAVVELTADAASINTENEMRDNHLKGEDFLDAAKYPQVTFKSTSFKKAAGKNYTVAGDLTFHGVTKPVTLNAELVGTGVHPQNKKNLAGFKVTGTFKRSDFNFGTKYPTAMLSDEITIGGDLEFTQE
jgi:polyisoprenoid-binding protein YceI